MEDKQKKEFEHLTIGDVKKIYENLLNCQNINKIEWTEEDERICNSIIADIKSLKKSRTSSLDSYFEECISWLESLNQRIGG